MVIKVFYKSGAYTTFDTSCYYSPDPFKREGISLISELNLRLDLLTRLGLVLEVTWQSKNSNQKSEEVREAGLLQQAFAEREYGNYIQLVSVEELAQVLEIRVDGKLILVRLEDELINVLQFMRAARLYGTDKTSPLLIMIKATNDILEKDKPHLSQQERARELGMSSKCLRSACERTKRLESLFGKDKKNAEAEEVGLGDEEIQELGWIEQYL